MINKGNVMGVNFWLPTDEELGKNAGYEITNKSPVFQKLFSSLSLTDFLEPNYYTGGTTIWVDDLLTANMICWNNLPCIKCNGVVSTRDFLKSNRFGMLGRSSDCLMVGIISKNSLWMLHVSVEALNNGIMKTIPRMEEAYAILGPCISKDSYSLTDDLYTKRCSNYSSLGYDKHCIIENSKTFIDIRAIVISELKAKNISIAFNDIRDTYTTNTLSSHRRDKDTDLPATSNSIILWCS